MTVHSLVADRVAVDSADSDASTSTTIRQMYSIVNEYISNHDVDLAVQQALTGLPSNTGSRQVISKIFFWIKGQIKFVTDQENIKTYLPQVNNPDDTELLITPDLVLKIKSGDCDCFSMLASAMLRIAGLPTRFVTIAADVRIPNVFSHVYLEVWDIDHQLWLPFDVSHGQTPDWEYKNVTRRYVWTD